MMEDEKTVLEDDGSVSEISETVFEGEDTVLEEKTVFEENITIPESHLTGEKGLDKTGLVIENSSIQKGDTILDTYSVESDAIEGGMGSVWRVHHKNWDVDLAMKRPQPRSFVTEKSKLNFIGECEAWIKLGLHPNIVSCYYVREISGIPTIFSEWMDGGSLESQIKNETLYKGSEAEQQERIIDIAIQFARGLNYAHEAGLIHQDVKPDNLLLTEEGEAKVSDFGLAKARASLTIIEKSNVVIDDSATVMAASGGYTPAYCSMEQMDGKVLSRRTDIYSWAVSVMEMYVGYRPWANGVVAGLNCRDYIESTRIPVSDKMKNLLYKCLEQEPENRPHDFAEIEEKLYDVYKIITGTEYSRPKPETIIDTADSLNNRALSFLDLGKYDEAIRLWDNAIKKDISNFRCHYNRAVAQWKNNLIDADELYSCVMERKEASVDWENASRAVSFAKAFDIKEYLIEEIKKNSISNTIVITDEEINKQAQISGISLPQEPLYKIDWEQKDGFCDISKDGRRTLTYDKVSEEIIVKEADREYRYKTKNPYNHTEYRFVDYEGDIICTDKNVVDLINATTGRSLLYLVPESQIVEDITYFNDNTCIQYSENRYVCVENKEKGRRWDHKEYFWLRLPPVNPKVDFFLSKISSLSEKQKTLFKIKNDHHKALEYMKQGKYEDILELFSYAVETGIIFQYEPALKLWENLFDYCNPDKLITVIPTELNQCAESTQESEAYKEVPDGYEWKLNSYENDYYCLNAVEKYTVSENYNGSMDIDFIYSLQAVDKDNGKIIFSFDRLTSDFQTDDGIVEYGIWLILKDNQLWYKKDNWSKIGYADLDDIKFQKSSGFYLALPGNGDYHLKNVKDGVDIGGFFFDDTYYGNILLNNSQVIQCQKLKYRLIYQYKGVRKMMIGEKSIANNENPNNEYAPNNTVFENDETVYEDDKTVLEDNNKVNEADNTVYEDEGTVLESEETVLENGITMPEATSYDTAAQGLVESAVENTSIKKGDTILDTYTVESDAIEGGMGSVWRVHHKNWNVDLAMKRPQPKCFSTEKSKTNFIEECKSWINLGLHPNIVSCYYVREISGVPTIFSEWMTGGSLESAIKNETLYEGSENEQQKRILDIAIQFARGLHYAHEAGLIHQDVKPDNLLLTKEGEAKVADFGLAKARATLTVIEDRDTVIDDGATVLAASGGYTPAYCSMEQMDGKVLSRRTDIYSWAVSVMEMFVGSRSWANGVVAGLNCHEYLENTRVSLPDELKELLVKCMEAEPDNRPHDFAEIETDLYAIYKKSIGKDYLRPTPKTVVDTADSLNNRALSMLDLGNNDEAERLWKQALEKNPHHTVAMCNLQLYLWNTGRINDLDVISSLEVLERDSQDKKVREVLSQFYLHTYNFDQLSRKNKEWNVEDKGNLNQPLKRRCSEWECAVFTQSGDILAGKDNELVLMRIESDDISIIQKLEDNNANLQDTPNLKYGNWKIRKIIKTSEKNIFECHFSSVYYGYMRVRIKIVGETYKFLDYQTGYVEMNQPDIDNLKIQVCKVKPEQSITRLEFYSKSSKRCLCTYYGSECFDVSQDGKYVLIDGGTLLIAEIPDDLPIDFFSLSVVTGTKEGLRNEEKAKQITNELSIAIDEKNYVLAIQLLKSLRAIPGFETFEEVDRLEALIADIYKSERISFAKLCSFKEIVHAPEFEPSNDRKELLSFEKKIQKKKLGSIDSISDALYINQPHKIVSITVDEIGLTARMAVCYAYYKKTGRYGSDGVLCRQIYNIDNLSKWCNVVVEKRKKNEYVISHDGSYCIYAKKMNVGYRVIATNGETERIIYDFYGKCKTMTISNDKQYWASIIDFYDDSQTAVVIVNINDPTNIYRINLTDENSQDKLHFSNDGLMLDGGNYCIRIGYDYSTEEKSSPEKQVEASSTSTKGLFRIFRRNK